MMHRPPPRRHCQLPVALRLAGLGILLAAFSAPAEQAASSTPYAALHHALEPALAISAYPRLRALKRIESKLPGVPASAIRLTIERAAGPVEIRPAADGTIDFPLDATLLAENPPVRSNQPRGSLVLSATLTLAAPPARSLPATFFTAALDEADQLLAANGGPTRTAGVELRFAADAQATVTLRGPAERTLVADHAGRIVLLRDRDLDGDTGPIELSTTPTLMLPWLGTARAGSGDDDD